MVNFKSKTLTLVFNYQTDFPFSSGCKQNLYICLYTMKFLSLLLVALAVAAQVAVYWGQNSYGGEQLLASYCDALEIDVVLLGFLNGYPNLNLNFGNQCNGRFELGLLDCPEIAADIKYCQSQGKKVLLSLGGAKGEYGFSSAAEGEQFALTLWNKFAGGNDAERPFGDAQVDGFDLDMENKHQTGYVAMAKKLRQLYDSLSRQYYLSAAPQCVYPDASVGDVMLNVPLDFAFVQFYNNYCSVDGQFNWDTWAQWAAALPNPNVKLYLGLPGASTSAGSGYISPQQVCSTVDEIKDSANFGGVMFWDASSSFANKDMISTVGQCLKGEEPEPVPSSSLVVAQPKPTLSLDLGFSGNGDKPGLEGGAWNGTVVVTNLHTATATVDCPTCTKGEGAVATSTKTNVHHATATVDCPTCTQEAAHDAEVDLGNGKAVIVDGEDATTTIYHTIYASGAASLGYDNSGDAVTTTVSQAAEEPELTASYEIQVRVTVDFCNPDPEAAFSTVTAYIAYE